MKNKILIKLIVPSLNDEFEIFVPVNERISKVKELLVKSIKDISDSAFDDTRIYSLLDPDTGTIYDSRLPIRDTNIKNSKKVILF
jgi:hypothetical protein